MADIASLLQVKLKGKDGETNGPLDDNIQILAIYFSAHWCPPCRGFTPTLAECYKKVNASGKKFEIVFASLDKAEKEFDSYYADMPWLAIPFEESDARESLAEKYKVSGIPALIFINKKDGSVVNADGRACVVNDENGEKFPWN